MFRQQSADTAINVALHHGPHRQGKTWPMQPCGGPTVYTHLLPTTSPRWESHASWLEKSFQWMWFRQKWCFPQNVLDFQGFQIQIHVKKCINVMMTMIQLSLINIPQHFLHVWREGLNGLCGCIMSGEQAVSWIQFPTYSKDPVNRRRATLWD